MSFKNVALIIISLIFIYKLIIMFIQTKSINNKIPERLKEVYNVEEYNKWKSYTKEKNKLNFISIIVNYLFIFLLLLFDVFALITNNIENIYSSSFIVLVFYIVTSGLVSIPFDYVSTMKIEEKYGFNKTTTKTFIVDQIKGFIISLIIFGLILILYILVHQALGDYILIVFTVIIIILFIFMVFISPIIMKISNKFTPLEDGTLKEKLTNLLEKYDYKVKEIRIMDGSKRSTKANANISGFGKLKTITLYDTLLDIVTEDEIVAIFAHEVAHGKKKHILKQTATSLIAIFAFIFISWGIIKIDIFEDFGFNNINYGFLLIFMVEVVMGIFSFLAFIPSMFSRKNEYEADKFAKDLGYQEQLVSGLIKLGKCNFTNLNPNKFVAFMSYSHPPIKERIEALEK